MPDSDLIIRGARVHNLRNISLDLPRDKLIVFTGVSGSGKSSLAFDTLFAEGQRRYVQSMSSYARQFLGQLEKPDVDFIGGLSPSISIEQKSAARNPRSTVGTVTEIYDFLRVLFARVGSAHCTQCGRLIGAQTREEVIARILDLPERTRFHVLAPVARGQKGEYRDLFEDMRKQGYVRARVDGQFVEMTENLQLERHMRHDVEIVIDRLVMKKDIRSRLAEAVEQALAMGEGLLMVAVEGKKDLLLSANYACNECGISYQEPTPQLFSFNSPQGMCSSCAGLGTKVEITPDLMLVDPSKSILGGAFHKEVFKKNRWMRHIYEGVARHLGLDLNQSWSTLTPDRRRGFLYGTGDAHIDFVWNGRHGDWHHGGNWEGLIPIQMRRYGQVGERKRGRMEEFMRTSICLDCEGQRLRVEARAVKIDSLNLAEVCEMTVRDSLEFFSAVKFTPTQLKIGEDALKEITGRLGFLMNVGLDYLTLDRSAPTLSGGEAQRIRMASQIGSGLVGVTYILDEPSIGLHPRDNAKLLDTLKALRDQGNTVVVVEHDEETMRAADHIVDFGPGPGVEGGEIVVEGNYNQVAGMSDSITGQFLTGVRRIPLPEIRRKPKRGRWLTVSGARHNNLKTITIKFPLETFTVVTGVSGSGKSSLVNDILWQALARDLNGAKAYPGAHRRIHGIEKLEKATNIDQSPIGRTPRSNPATYVGVLGPIRDLFASLPDANVRGYKKGRFSFNVRGGRCEACEGHGANRLEMDFLADIWVTCPVCSGKRFNRETLDVRYKGKNIADVLNMDVQEALEHFENIPRIRRMLEIMDDVGLGYLKLGQSSTTLSGGEAQRIKLSEQLVRPNQGGTLYILDEPTTGLHFADVQKLLDVLQRFVDAGNTVIVVEHNLEVIKTADYLIDLGPEGGEEGGEVVAIGTPEEVARCAQSHTGQVLAVVLNKERNGKGRARRKARKRRSVNNQISEIKNKKSRLTDVVILGARQHNLKNLEVKIPREKLTVFSGVSGSGKSSLALDTIYAEGQRRYVESLSAYARQFLSQMPKPKVEHVSGLSPAIAIEQKAPSKNPRSTVGTVTEIYDFLRVLWARLGQPHCYRCGAEVSTQTSGQIVDRILSLPEKTHIYLLASVEPRDNEDYVAMLERFNREGYARARMDGEVIELGTEIGIDRRRKHQVEILLDRLTVRSDLASRLASSVEAALDLGRGVVFVHRLDTEEDIRFSQFHACQVCGASFEELSARNFAFNIPLGWCEGCEGLGTQRGAHPRYIIPNPKLSLRKGAVKPWGKLQKDSFGKLIYALARHVGFSLDMPFNELHADHRRAVLFGLREEWIPGPNGIGFQYNGIFPTIDWCTRHSTQFRRELHYLAGEVECLDCRGDRMRPDAAVVRFLGKTLPELCRMPIGETHELFLGLEFTDREKRIAGEVFREINNRLRFLVDVGLEYLTLDRPAPSLSGGESQRIRLASQIGSGLTGVLYVLDEPTIGLHPRDNRRMLDALEKLRDLGNTLIVVEHDRDTLEKADHIIDFGPQAGINGGEIVGKGSPKRLSRSKRSLTGKYLGNSLTIDVPVNRRVQNIKRNLEVVGARHNNLKDISVRFPLSNFICVTGVSGSGKSSLVFDILHNRLANDLHRARAVPAEHDEIIGLRHVNKVISIDQSPIGFSPRSDPATYVGVFDEIRNLYASLPDSKVRGYTPRRFSFNQGGGRCDTCRGYGHRLVEMHFLPDVWIECDTCHGDRYNPETLAVKFKGRSISDVLHMTVAEALEHFMNIPRIRRYLQTLFDVGLGYLQLGQSAPTLSGGEAQRVKLSAELARPSTGKTVYLLDEPTTGLHIVDIQKLLAVLNRLVDRGNTVIVIEHNMEVIKTADWIVDLGPEGGEDGGYLVAEGNPEQVARMEHSHTGRLLHETLGRSKYAEREVFDFEAYRKSIYRVEKEDELTTKTAMPWQTSGRKWHLGERLTKGGARPIWDAEVLEVLVDFVLEDDAFEVDWDDRDEFKIKVRGKRMPFIVARSTEPKYALVRIRTFKGQFTEDKIIDRLNWPNFNELSGYPVYASWQRIWSRSGGATFDEYHFAPAVRGDFGKSETLEFVREAMDGFKELVCGGQKGIVARGARKSGKDRTWHLDRKEREGHPIAWQPEAVDVFDKLVRAFDFVGEPDYSDDEKIVFPVKGAKQPFAELNTHWWKRLELVLRPRKDDFDEKTILARLGLEGWMETWPRSFDRLCLHVLSISQVENSAFMQFLKKYARGFEDVMMK